ncbi:unnamed protein product, partial [Durusdinium trenchii]
MRFTPVFTASGPGRLLRTPAVEPRRALDGGERSECRTEAAESERVSSHGSHASRPVSGKFRGVGVGRTLFQQGYTKTRSGRSEGVLKKNISTSAAIGFRSPRRRSAVGAPR